MDQSPFVEDIERRLTRLACDAIMDPSPDAVALAVEEFAAVLDAGGASVLAVRVREVVASTADRQAAVSMLRPMWCEWCAEDEVQRDIDALAGDPELAGMFVAEALDHLGTIEATLLRLEKTPGDKTLLNDVFRPFHTIKGNAGALGVSTVQELAHKVENLLDRCRSGQHAVGLAEVDVVLKAVDLITAMLNGLTARIAGRPGRAMREERLTLVEMVDRLIEGGSAVEAPPPADSIPFGDVADSQADEPRADTPVAAQPPAHAPQADTAQADKRRAAEPRIVPRTESPQAAEPVEARAVGAPAKEEVHESQAAVKVDTRKLDGLVDTVGELVILQSLIYEFPGLAGITDERFTRNLAQLRRITTELQRGAMAMRMVPIRQTFQKMARLVRDLSKRSGKQVELVLAGEDTELDRKVVEDINDPLMHMVRNSLDHGLESRDVRLAAGKSETGRLSLRAFHQGGNIVIEIADDGAGLNRARILKKAIANGLLPPGATPSPAEINALIFAPGFSTAEQVTEISGRGVGMDVVRRNIDALRGRIDIDTEEGRGTRISIKLPLTLAILDGLLVTVGSERFVIPTFAIRESLRPTTSQVHTLQGTPRLIQVRDELLPLVWLRELFEIGGERVDPTQATVVVIEDEHHRVGLVVDALIGKQEVVVKTLGASFSHVRGVAGGAILGDGRIGLILDANGILKLMHQEAA